jgi:hypothetical protein
MTLGAPDIARVMYGVIEGEVRVRKLHSRDSVSIARSVLQVAIGAPAGNSTTRVFHGAEVLVVATMTDIAERWFGLQ